MDIPTTRRAKIHISPETLARMIDLPAGLRIRQIYSPIDPNCIWIIVEGDMLGEAPDNAEAPVLFSNWSRYTITNPEDGKDYHRMRWELPQGAGTGTEAR